MKTKTRLLRLYSILSVQIKVVKVNFEIHFVRIWGTTYISLYIKTCSYKLMKYRSQRIDTVCIELLKSTVQDYKL